MINLDAFESVSVNVVMDLHKGYFFSKGAMGGFGTNVLPKAYVYGKSEYLFCTSDLTGELKRSDRKRRWTIRRCNRKTGDISSFSKLNQYSTRLQCMNALLDALLTEARVMRSGIR